MIITTMQNKSSRLRKPSKHCSNPGSIERTAWAILFSSNWPTVVHWLEGSGWYSSTWQAKIIKYIANPLQVLFANTKKLVHFKILTSDLMDLSSWSYPPLSLIRPPTTEARTPNNVLGREARDVQDDALDRRVTTEELSSIALAEPPAMIYAWKCQSIIVWASLTPVEGRAAQAWPYLFSGSWGSSSTKPWTLYLQQL